MAAPLANNRRNRQAPGGGKVQFFEDCEENLLHLVERPADFGLMDWGIAWHAPWARAVTTGTS